MSKFNRRNFLKKSATASLLLGASNPLGVLLSNIFNTAYASADSPKTFISLFHPGGPPRWMFDLLLKVNADDQLISNPMVGTKFTASEHGPQLSYDVQNINNKGLFLPPIWSANLPTSGEDFNLSSLIDHTLFVRSVLTVPVHSLAFSKNHIHGSTAGIHTLAQEQKTTPLTCLQYGRFYIPFKARNKVTDLFINSDSGFDPNIGDNPVQSILEPFVTGLPPSALFSEKMNNIYEGALEIFAKSTGNSRYNLKKGSILNDQALAKKLFSNQISRVIESYEQIYNKYKTIIAQCFDRELIPGLCTSPTNDPNHLMALPDVGTSLNKKKYWSSTSQMFIRSDEIPSIGHLHSSANCHNDLMASSFAVTELILSTFENNQQFTHSIVCDLGNNILRSAEMYLLSTNERRSLTNFNARNDSHYTGSVTTLYNFSKFYCSFAACLGELIINKMGGLSSPQFKNTLIQYSSDFNRSPRIDQTGSDHSNHGVLTYFSGAIQNPDVKMVGDAFIGNGVAVENYDEVDLDTIRNKTNGDWGEASRTPRIDSANCFEGVAKFLGVEPITNSFESVFKINNEKVELNTDVFPSARNILKED